MCGIVGYIGRQACVPILMGGLGQVEYRGYDSAGIAVITPTGAVKVHRRAGKLATLADSLPKRFAGRVGIAHTRWATHGAPDRRQRAPAPGPPRARSRSSTTASSTTPPTCARKLEADGVVLRLRDRHRGASPTSSRRARGRHRWRRRSARRSPVIEGTYGIAVMHADFAGPHRRRPQRLAGRPRHRREGDVRRLRRRRAGRPHPPGRHPRRRRDGHPQGRRLPHLHHRGHAAPQPRPTTVEWEAAVVRHGRPRHATCTRRSPSSPTPSTACCAAGSTTASPPSTSAASNLDAREARGIRRVKILGCGTVVPRGHDRRPADRGAGPHPRRRRAGLRVPLPQPGRGPRHPLHRGLPVRRDVRRARGRPGAQAQGRAACSASSTSSARRSPARPTAASTCTPAPRSASSPPSASPTRSSPSRCSPLHLGRIRDLSVADGKRIIEGLRKLPDADRARSSTARRTSRSSPPSYAEAKLDAVHRPGPRLPGGPRGRP